MDMELGSSARLLIKNRKRDENTGAANYESGNRGKFSHQPGSNQTAHGQHRETHATGEDP